MSIAAIVAAMPSAGHRAQALVRGQVGHQQAEQAEDDGHAGGQDGRAGPEQRRPHRVVLVLVPAQLLPEPGDDQQRVIRAGAEDQHGEDALALPVEGEHVAAGQPVDQPGRERVRRAHGQQREQPQHGAAVDQQQDHDDHDPGHQQQGRVDPAERGDEVGQDPGRPGHVGRQPAPLLHHQPHRRDRVGQLVAVGAGDLHDRLHGLAVLGWDRVADRRHPRHLLDVGQLLPDRREVVRGDPGRPLPDQDRRRGVLVHEPPLQLVDLGRLRRLGQEGGVVVLLDLGQPAGERPGDGQHEQPEQQQAGADPAAAGGGGRHAALLRPGAILAGSVGRRRDDGRTARPGVGSDPWR
ncbi:MAG TPA: hypothetical protein VI357_05910 [Mycobacteriales bacterium]